jgi:hypothetical protein
MFMSDNIKGKEVSTYIDSFSPEAGEYGIGTSSYSAVLAF